MWHKIVLAVAPTILLTTYKEGVRYFVTKAEAKKLNKAIGDPTNMETELVTVFIEKQIWTCPRTGHNHKTKLAAERCITQCKNTFVPKVWTEEDVDRLYALKKSGITLTSIAKEINRSPSFTRQLIKRAERKEWEINELARLKSEKDKQC